MPLRFLRFHLQRRLLVPNEGCDPNARVDRCTISNPPRQSRSTGCGHRAYEFNKLAMHCLENDYEIDPNAARKSMLNLCREPNNNFPFALSQRLMQWEKNVPGFLMRRVELRN